MKDNTLNQTYLNNIISKIKAEKAIEKAVQQADWDSFKVKVEDGTE